MEVWKKYSEKKIIGKEVRVRKWGRDIKKEVELKREREIL